MAEGRGELEVYNNWFAAADLDRDGVLSGAEAVAFFQRSGLPQNPTLFKVWQYVAGDRPALSRQEFYTAMKLVSLAQLNNGVLDDQQALRLVNGLAGPVPLPRMQGMGVPRGIELPAALLPPAAAPAPAEALAPARAAPAAPSPARSAAAAPAAAPPPSAAFPPLSAEQAAAFQMAFSQLDTDRDGFVQGTDCFGAFMQSGLPKASLKQIWDLVAGNEPRLNRHQFVQALYLIDCAKRGTPVPTSLPPGSFPPVAGAVSIGGMMGTPSDIYSATLVIPDMVPHQTYQAQPLPPQPFASQVPGLPADRLATLDAADRMRLESEREAALKAEAEQRKAEEERAAAAAKREFFTRALGDLRLTQSKVTRAVVEAQQRCEMERSAADQMEADYSRAYAEFSAKHAQSAPLVQQLKQIQDEKAALAQKLEALRAMVQQLEDFDPEWETREKGECEALNVEIAALTVKKEQLQQQAASTQRKREALAGQVAALKEAAASAEAELASLQEQTEAATAEGGADKEAVVGLLKRVAPLYNRLYDAAKAAMVPLPAEAVATLKREASPFRFDELATACAADWGTFKDEGFKIVAALPVDTRLATFAPPSAASLAKDDDALAAAGAAPAAEGSAAPDASAAPETTAAEAAGPLTKATSTAEAEAVNAAAEAGPLASAIAEALAGVGPAPKAAAKAGGKSGGKPGEGAAAADEPGGESVQPAEPEQAAGTAEAQPSAEGAAGPAAEETQESTTAAPTNPFEVAFGDGKASGAADDAAAAAAAAPAAGVDAFAAFDDATGAASSPSGEAAAAVKPAAGAFGSSQALTGADSPSAGVGEGGSQGSKPAAGAAPPAEGWTAF
ncbi:hypothetical protein ABPG77_006236 [Micractinium sp. CCAP 211/92]